LGTTSYLLYFTLSLPGSLTIFGANMVLIMKQIVSIGIQFKRLL
jgi:hypothetical protein